jgi:predicted transcriptional regulator
MTTLKVGIASYEDMKARRMEVARGKRRVLPGEPKVWLPQRNPLPRCCQLEIGIC